MYLFVFPLKLRKWETRVLSIDQRIQWARGTIFQNLPQVYASVIWLPGEMKTTVQAAACARSNVPGRLEGFRCCPYPSGSRELSTKAAGGRGQSWWWYKGQGSSGLERRWFFLLRNTEAVFLILPLPWDICKDKNKKDHECEPFYKPYVKSQLHTCDMGLSPNHRSPSLPTSPDQSLSTPGRPSWNRV